MKSVDTIRALACTASLNVLKCDTGMLNCSDSDPGERFRGRQTEGGSPLDKRCSVAVESPFPLTLTLPRGEGTVTAGSMFSAHWFGKLRRGYGRKMADDSPSPQGRGPGRGERKCGLSNGPISYSKREFVAHTVDGQQMFRFAAVVPEFFPQLHDHLVQRARCAVVVVAPDFVEQPVARQHFARVGVKHLQQFQLFRRQFFNGLASLELKGFRVDDRGTDLKRRVTGSTGCGVGRGAAEQRVD